MMASLFIGMPVYNGEQFIAQALETLIKQSFKDWTLLISDNASTDSTPQISRSYCNKDSRIKYFRQPANIGAMNNFKYLIDIADTDFFMWAGSDDEWDVNFLEACIGGLKDPQVDWSFTNIVNIDSYGRVVREYPSLRPFCEGERYLRIARYVLSLEIYGKANLIYSVYRLPKIKAHLSKLLISPDVGVTGYDMAINLALLCRANLHIDEQPLFRKRHVSPTDSPDGVKMTHIALPTLSGTLREDFSAYRLALINVCRETEFEELVRSILDVRAQYQDDLSKLHEKCQTLTAELKIEKNLTSLRKIYRFIKSQFSKGDK